MALADATVRVILDVSRFDRDLDSKVGSAARRAGKSFERQFTKSAGEAGKKYAAEFRVAMRDGLGNSGKSIGTAYGVTMRAGIKDTGRLTGQDLGVQIRGGLASTADLTGRQYGRGLSGAITQAGARIGKRLGAAIGANLHVGGGGGGGSGTVGKAIARDNEPGVLDAAKHMASRFGSAFGGALSAIAPGRMAFLGTAIAGLVVEAGNLGAAAGPALQAVGLIPGGVALAAAAVTTLVVAFQGMGDAFSAAASGDPEKLADALKNVTPAAASVALEFGRLSPRFRELRKEVQQSFFSQLTGDLTRMGAALVGPVQAGMSRSAAAAGRMASELAGMVGQARNAAIIERIFGGTAQFFQRMSVPLARMTQGMFSWINATLPAFARLTDSLGLATDRFGDFLSVSARSGKTMTWVDQATATLGQLWSIAKNLTGVLVGIFSAAGASSGGYLANLNNILVATREFLTAGEGRTPLVNLFAGLHRVVAALGNPLREAVIQLGSVAGVAGDVAEALSAGVTAAVRAVGQALTSAGPGLTTFAESITKLVQDIGPSVANLGASFGRLLEAISPLVSIVGLVLRAGLGLVDLFSRLPGGVLGAVAAFAALKFLGVDTMLSSIANRGRDMFTSMRSGTGVLGTLTSTYQAQLAQLTALRVQQGFLANTMTAGIPAAGGFGAAIGGMVDRTAAAGSAIKSVAMPALRGFVGLLGGPFGIAITAASVLLGIWASKQTESAQKTKEHEDHVLALAQSFDKSTGSITANTVETVRNKAEMDGLLQKGRDLGINTSNFITALTGEASAVKSTNDELRSKARSLIENSAAYKRLVAGGADATSTLNVLTDAALGNRDAFDRTFAMTGDVVDEYAALGWEALGSAGGIDKLAGAVKQSGTDMDAAKRQYNEFQAAMSKTVGSTTVFGQALSKMADTAASAEEKTRALREALRALEGGTQTVTDAQVAQYDSLRGITDRVTALNEQYGKGGNRATEFGKAIFDAGGKVDATSKGVSELTRTSRDLNDRMADVAAAAADQAKKTGDWAGAQKTIGDAYNANRTSLIDLGRAMGFSAEEAAKFADQALRTPQQLITTFNLVGAPDAIKQIGEVQLRLQQVAPGQSIYMTALTSDAQKALEALGFQVEKMKDGQLKITPKTAEALAAIKGLKIEADRATGTLKLTADNEQAKGKVAELGALLAQGASTTLDLDTGKAYLTASGFMVYVNGQTGEIKIGAEPKDAKDKTQALKDFVNNQTASLKIGGDPKPFQDTLDGLLGAAQGNQANVPIGADGRPLITDLGGLLGQVNSSTANVPTGINPLPAQAQLPGLVGSINSTSANVPTGLNTGGAGHQLDVLAAQIRNTSANVKIGANDAAAQATLASLIIQASRTVVTMAIRAVTQQGNAIGGIRDKRGALMFRHGGITGAAPMPANRAAIVPPNAMRVIGDRAVGDEAFIPLINSARSHAILRAAAARMGYDLASRRERRPSTTRTTTVAAGAITVHAPNSDPNLVARAVLNQLTREAVI